jgi:hypothetical protein
VWAWRASWDNVCKRCDSLCNVAGSDISAIPRALAPIPTTATKWWQIHPPLPNSQKYYLKVPGHILAYAELCQPFRFMELKNAPDAVWFGFSHPTHNCHSAFKILTPSETHTKYSKHTLRLWGWKRRKKDNISANTHDHFIAITIFFDCAGKAFSANTERPPLFTNPWDCPHGWSISSGAHYVTLHEYFSRPNFQSFFLFFLFFFSNPAKKVYKHTAVSKSVQRKKWKKERGGAGV